MEVHVLHVDFAEQRDRLRSVREAVFVAEQGVDPELEWDGQDEGAEHFLALNEMGVAIGCARLLPSGQIGRMAVLPDHRGQGIGRQLLDIAVQHAQQVGLTEAFLHAQTHATRFYQRAGFEARGPEFQEAGIPHVEMHLRLPIPFEADPSAASLAVVNPPRSAPEGTSELLQFDGDGEARDVLLRVIETASRSIEIFSPFLDQALFGDDACIEQLSRFARRAPRAFVRILIVDSKLIVARGHPLLELARRLSSKIELLKVPDHYPVDERRSFVVADGRAVWWLPDHTVPTGWADLHNPVQARRVLDEFERLYERGLDDPDLRLLSL